MLALRKDLPNYQRTRGHNEFPGYAWKQCPLINYAGIIAAPVQTGATKPAESLPNTYTIQEGDTFWSIANELTGVSVNDLIKANPDDPVSLLVTMGRQQIDSILTT